MSRIVWVLLLLKVCLRTDTGALPDYSWNMHHTVILAVGCDPVLLDTRSQVLREAGYTVVSTISLSQSVIYFLDGDFDLILLCHSIPVGGRERLAQLMRQHAPRTPIVTVVSYLGEKDPFADASIENDPENLVAGLSEVLKERTRSQRTIKSCLKARPWQRFPIDAQELRAVLGLLYPESPISILLKR